MKKKILIIEDDIQIGSLEEEALNNNGCLLPLRHFVINLTC